MQGGGDGWGLGGDIFLRKKIKFDAFKLIFGLKKKSHFFRKHSIKARGGGGVWPLTEHSPKNSTFCLDVAPYQIKKFQSWMSSKQTKFDDFEQKQKNSSISVNSWNFSIFLMVLKSTHQAPSFEIKWA